MVRLGMQLVFSVPVEGLELTQRLPPTLMNSMPNWRRRLALEQVLMFLYVKANINTMVVTLIC